jgi:hypothetical protein
MNSMGAVMDAEKIVDPENPSVVVQTDGWQIPVEFLADLPVNIQRRWRQVENAAKAKGEAPDWTQIMSGSTLSNRNGDFDFAITSPRSVIGPGTLEVDISTERNIDLSEVSYFWGNQLMYKAARAPFTGKFEVPKSSRVGGTYTIRAVAVSEDFQTAEDSIRVRLTNNAQNNSSVSSGDGYNGPPEIIFLGPRANQRLSINAEAQIVAEIAGSDIETVEFFLNNQSLGFKNTPPYVMNFETPDKIGRSTLTIKVANANGLKSEKSIPITIDREAFSEANNPFISEVNKNFRTLSLTFTLPNYENLEAAQIVVSQPENIIHQETWQNPEKFKYLFLPSQNFADDVNVELYVKAKGETDFTKADSEFVRY